MKYENIIKKADYNVKCIIKCYKKLKKIKNV